MKSGFDRIGFTVTVEHAKRSCLEKVRYFSRNAARDRAAYLAKRYPESPHQRPYRCTICGDFHLTTKTPNGLKGRGEPPAKARGKSQPAQQSTQRLSKEG